MLAKHNQRGIVSMGNSGKNSNSSQFFITFDACPQCDGKHVIFGRVVSGWPVLDAIEKLGATDGSGEPTAPIAVTDCGIWKPQVTPGDGFWYDQPDSESYSGVSPMFVVRPRVAVVGPAPGVVQKFQAVLDGCVVVPIVMASNEEGNETSPTVSEQIVHLLNEFAVDVVVVAPACSQKVVLPLTNLSEAWNGKDVVVQAKPVQALAAIRQQTWLADQQSVWQFDGLWN